MRDPDSKNRFNGEFEEWEDEMSVLKQKKRSLREGMEDDYDELEDPEYRFARYRDDDLSGDRDEADDEY